MNEQVEVKQEPECDSYIHPDGHLEIWTADYTSDFIQHPDGTIATKDEVQRDTDTETCTGDDCCTGNVVDEMKIKTEPVEEVEVCEDNTNTLYWKVTGKDNMPDTLHTTEVDHSKAYVYTIQDGAYSSEHITDVPQEASAPLEIVYDNMQYYTQTDMPSYESLPAEPPCEEENGEEIDNIDQSSFICQECGSSFPERGQLEEHMVTHTKETAFICRECGEGFINTNALIRHFSSHPNVLRCKCNKCGKWCNDHKALERHINNVHGHEKPFACKECGQILHDSNSLQDHLKIHTATKPFVCTECSRCFKHSFNLVKHMTIHDS
ncbi:uncharacterized protein LOC144434665 [Glandiceps talaboti]